MFLQALEPPVHIYLGPFLQIPGIHSKPIETYMLKDTSSDCHAQCALRMIDQGTCLSSLLYYLHHITILWEVRLKKRWSEVAYKREE